MRSRTAEPASYQAFEALCEPRGPAPGRASRLRQRLWLRAVGTLGRELIKLGLVLGHAKPGKEFLKCAVLFFQAAQGLSSIFIKCPVAARQSTSELAVLRVLQRWTSLVALNFCARQILPLRGHDQYDLAAPDHASGKLPRRTSSARSFTPENLDGDGWEKVTGPGCRIAHRPRSCRRSSYPLKPRSKRPISARTRIHFRRRVRSRSASAAAFSALPVRGAASSWH